MADISAIEGVKRVPEAWYAYYRRCQMFRKGGKQCKAPAEKGSHICYAHAGQLAMAVRRERERRAVLEEAVAQMRRKGKPNCEMADLFMDFKGINMTLAVMAQAVIDGRVDCKTVGRLLVQLQTVSKLLRMIHRKGREGRKENRISPQIYADERRLKTKIELLINTNNTDLKKANLTTKSLRHGEQHEKLPLIDTDNADLRKPAKAEGQNFTAGAQRRGEERETERSRAANEYEQTRITLAAEVVAIAERRGWAHAPPELFRAA